MKITKPPTAARLCNGMALMCSKKNMSLVLLLCFITLSSSFISAQCPANFTSIFIINDRTINVPLTVPLCLQCRFFSNQGNYIPFSDGVWRKGSTVLNNGDFSGNVNITSDSYTTTLTLNYPDAVVDVGDTLTFSSSSVGQQSIITIGAFVFLNPIVFPNGTVNVTEGSNLTLTCSDPGNSGIPRYVWINDTDGSELTAVVNNPPLSLQLTNITRNISGNYTCRSTNTALPGVYKDSTVTVGVFYLHIASDLVTKWLPVGSNYTVRCSFYSNLMVDSVTWSHNGTELNPNSISHISITTHSTYSELTLSPLQKLNDSGEYTCTLSNSAINNSEVLLNLRVQIRPAPVYNLAAPESSITNTSIRLTWSLGFDGYSSLTGGILSYVAVLNGEDSGVIPFTGESVMEKIVLSLQPYTGYIFSVIVTNGIGNSLTQSIFAMTQSNFPSAPTLNDVLALSSTFLFATWTDNRDPMTQQPVHTYRVVYYENGLIDYSTHNTTDTNLTIHNLSKGTSYSVLVYAINAIGTSAPSNIITTVTGVDAPSPVTNVILISYPDSICISWSLPVDDGGEQIGGYHIYLRNLNNTSGFRKISSLASSTNFQLLDHLSANIAYEIIIAAFNTKGGHGQNASFINATDNPFLIDQGISLILNSVTALSAQVNWTISNQVSNLRLQYNIKGGSNKNEIILGPSVTGHRLTGLNPETIYEIKLITLSSGGCEQNASSTINIKTLKLQLLVTYDYANLLYIAGDQVILECNLDTGGPPPSAVMWLFNGGAIQPSAAVDANCLILNNSNEEDTGNYTCLFNNASYTLMIVIRPLPQPANTTTSYSTSVSLSLEIIVLVFAVICTMVVTAIVTFGISYLCFKRKKQVIESNVDMQEDVKSAQATTVIYDELPDTAVTGMQANASYISTTVPKPGQMNLIGSTDQPTQSNPTYQPSPSADDLIYEEFQDDTQDNYENIEEKNENCDAVNYL